MNASHFLSVMPDGHLHSPAHFALQRAMASA